MKTLLTLFVFVISFVASAQDAPVLVDAKWLNDHKQNPKLVILQVSALKYDFDKEHIAGARFLWPNSLAPATPLGTMNMPDPKEATEILQKLGISNDSHIVICHVRNEVSPSARMFLTFENLGFKGKVSFLNGGLEAWKREGFPVTKEATAVKKGTFSLKKGGLIVDKDYVLKTVDSDKSTIVDARAQRFYDGETTGNPRDGHIKSAKNIYYVDLLDVQTNMFKPTEQLSDYFTKVQPDKSKEIVTYCFIGQTASVVYLSGRALGYDMKLYDGSMEEWSRYEDLPMEITRK